MTGRASAELICKAKVIKAISTHQCYVGSCGRVTRPDLINDGQYINFVTPEGWHVELGTTPEETIVRCPEHCTWIDISAQYKGQGQWQDAP